MDDGPSPDITEQIVTIVPEPVETRGRKRALHEDVKTLNSIRQLAAMHCTQRQAAAVLNVAEPTFHRFLSSSEAAREAWEDGRHQGAASLRQWQFAAAKDGNTQMLIWLGKQYLEQADKQERKDTTVIDGNSQERMKRILELQEKAQALVAPKLGDKAP